jgi:hypothetical protein
MKPQQETTVNLEPQINHKVVGRKRTIEDNMPFLGTSLLNYSTYKIKNTSIT